MPEDEYHIQRTWKKTRVTEISEPEVKDEVTTQTFKRPSAGWVGRCLLAGVSFAVAVSTHTLMSSMTALTYTHAAHICSSSLLSSSNRGILVQDYKDH